MRCHDLRPRRIALRALGATLTYFSITAGCYRDMDSAGEIQTDFVLGKPVSGDERTTFVQAGKPGIVLAGLLRDPCQPYELHAVAEREGAAVQLTVIGQNAGDCQPTRLGNVGYEAALCDYRRLRANYETEPSSSRGWILVAAIHRMARRLAPHRPVPRAAGPEMTRPILSRIACRGGADA